jgi:hypothetical protein
VEVFDQVVNWRFYSNTAIADTLAVPGGGNLSTSATSLYAGSGAPAGYPTSFPWTLDLEPGTSNFELVSVTAGAGTSATPWTVIRAYDGTTAKTHTAGVAIAHTWSANDLTTAASHYALGSGSGVHGLPAAAWLGNACSTINETTLLNSTTSVVTWSAIPATFQHLLISVQARLTETTALTDDITLTFNSDTGAHYSYLDMYATNISGSMVNTQATNYSLAGIPAIRAAASQGGAPANAGGGFIWIPNYAAAAFNKSAYALTGAGNGTSSMIDGRVRWGFWNPASQAAVTSVSLTAPGTSDFLVGSQFCLYGMG